MFGLSWCAVVSGTGELKVAILNIEAVKVCGRSGVMLKDPNPGPRPIPSDVLIRVMAE